jgi:thymidylate synthase ThyX
MAKDAAIKFAHAFYEADYHKQVYNRLMEAFQMQKTVLSATEVDNFFWLRDDDAADPTIRELASVMRQAMEQSTPEVLQYGEWHLPYVDWMRLPNGKQGFYLDVQDPHGLQHIPLTIDQAIKVSCARCAAVSYRNEGYNLAKSLEVYDRLVGSERKHASAFEHPASPMRSAYPIVTNDYFPDHWEQGISHMDRDGAYWSGNLCGWLQYRKLIPGECYSAASST